MVTIRCLISLTINQGWTLFQPDVNNAFLYGNLTEEVYMTLPPEYFSVDDKRVCKLVKSLYGLKQAPMQWNEKICVVLLENGFKQSKSYYSLFIKSDKDIFVALLVYVDDIVITGNKIEEVNKCKQFLKTKFQIKDLGILKYFLGIEVLKTKQGLCLSQRKYCLELLSEYGLLSCKPYLIPIESKLIITDKPMHKKDKPLKNITEYQKLLGKLIYLTHTRPNISYAVHSLSQFMHSPLNSHLKLALRILKYLKGDLDKVFLGKTLVSWKSKKQTMVARSSAEAEYQAMTFVTCEVMWLVNLLRDLKINVANPITILCDNKAAL
ncbi:ribonuclease H-like domain-containing protein [Tanacetum coccineum]